MSGGVLRLTEAVGDQNNLFFLDPFSGSAPVLSFSATFRVRLGSVSANGPADGFSFSFGPQVNGTPFLGEEGVEGALRVSFDTWDNGPVAPFLDLDAPAIDVFYGSLWRTNVSMAGARLGGHPPATLIPTDPATGQPMTLHTDGAFADVEIRLDGDGTMDVSYKGVKVLDNVATGYVPAVGRFAFGARTGGGWTTHYIDDLQIIVATQP